MSAFQLAEVCNKLFYLLIFITCMQAIRLIEIFNIVHKVYNKYIKINISSLLVIAMCSKDFWKLLWKCHAEQNKTKHCIEQKQ